MKSKELIEKLFSRIDTDNPKYPMMTYEDGVYEALGWVLGEIPDEEFSPIINKE